jgi:hypothetical protein
MPWEYFFVYITSPFSDAINIITQLFYKKYDYLYF